MVRVTALDIQVSLCDQMANCSGLSSNMAACGNPLLYRVPAHGACDCPGYPGQSARSNGSL